MIVQRMQWAQRVLLGSACVGLVACSDEATVVSNAPNLPAEAELEPAYIVLTDVPTAESSQLYLNVLPSPQAQAVTQGTGLELPRGSQAFAELGYVFVADGERLTLTRYEVTAERELANPVELAFVQFGLSFFENFVVIDAERAYLTARDEGLLIVWNPTTMEIVEDVPLIALEKNGFPGAFPSGRDILYAQNQLVRERGRLYLPVSWSSWDDAAMDASFGVLSVSTSDAHDQTLSTTSCASGGVFSTTGRDGKLYVLGSASWGPYRQYAAAPLPESALTRFDPVSNAFDDSYCERIQPLTDGDDGGLLLQYAPGQFLLRVIDEALVTYSSSADYWSDVQFGCRTYQGDIDESGALSLRERPEMSTVANGCFGGMFSVDGSGYFFGEDADAVGGTLLRWDGAAMVPEIGVAAGYVTAFERLR